MILCAACFIGEFCFRLEERHRCGNPAAHLGKTTQVWDSVVTHRETGKTIALFRCTQMILYPKSAA